MRAAPLLLLLLAAPAAGQDTLRLGALQEAAVRGDPRAGQLELLEARTGARIRNLDAQRFPQLRVGGEASHQSEVAALPVRLPGVEVPEPPSERYEASLGADLLLYDGGALEARRRAERAAHEAARAALRAELYPLRAEVAEAYFSALLLQERLRESAALVEELEGRLAEVRSRVREGAALPGDTAAVLAELLRVEQGREEVAAERRAALAVLGGLTGVGVSEAHVLALPDLAAEVERVAAAEEPARRAHPRFAALRAERERLEREAEVVGTRSRPQATAFGRLAYGSPGLAQFTDRPHDYWLAGVRVHWVPWDWGVAGRERAALEIQRRMLDAEEAALARRLERQAERPLAAIRRLEATGATDQRIVALREQVARQARAQFAERAITAAALVGALTDLQEARLARHRHRAQLARARAEYLTTLGVEPR